MIKENYVSEETRADRRVRLVRHGIKEDYVSFETAKLLKEKGFDEITLAWYTGKGKFCASKNTYSGYHMNEFSDTTVKHKNTCSAPTLQMAMKWLREKHHVVIDVCLGDYITGVDGSLTTTYTYTIWYFNRHLSHIGKTDIRYTDATIDGVEFESYEEAADVALKYSLENLI